MVFASIFLITFPSASYCMVWPVNGLTWVYPFGVVIFPVNEFLLSGVTRLPFESLGLSSNAGAVAATAGVCDVATVDVSDGDAAELLTSGAATPLSNCAKLAGVPFEFSV